MNRAIKKFIIVLQLLFMFFLSSYAQKYTLFTGLSGSLGGNVYHFNPSSIFTYADFKPTAAYSVSPEIGYYFEDNLFFKSGLMYAVEGYSIAYNYIIQDDNDPSIPDETTITISSLRVPIYVGIDIYNGRNLRFNPSLGIEPQFVLNTNESTRFINGSTKSSNIIQDNLNNFLIDIMLDISMEYKFNEIFSLSLIPFIGKGILKLDNEYMSSGKFRYGLQLGLVYNVKKLH